MFVGLKSLRRFYLSSNSIALGTNITTHASSNKFLHLGLGSCNLTRFPDFLLIEQYTWEYTWMDLQHEYLSISEPFIKSFNRIHPTTFVLPSSLFELELRFNQLQGSLPPVPTSSGFIYFPTTNWLVKYHQQSAIQSLFFILICLTTTWVERCQIVWVILNIYWH